MNLFRVDPLMPAQSYKTYQVSTPVGSHKRKASCEEIGCLHHMEGWFTRIDESTMLGQRQADYIRRQSGRRFQEMREPDGTTLFDFYPGQKCFNFESHYVSNDRPPLFIVRDGDHRGNPRGTKARVHSSAESWRDDFGEHQQALADRLERG